MGMFIGPLSKNDGCWGAGNSSCSRGPILTSPKEWCETEMWDFRGQTELEERFLLLMTIKSENAIGFL